ncbi:MAG: hypothetical protein M0030_11420 [Actinomycetota bacterium]|nr:hypothetical protein [Actinomycetota bacterium]
MTTPAGLPVLTEDTDALIAFACRIRRDWSRDQLAAAIAGARANQWTYSRIMTEVVRLAADPDGSPRSLSVAATGSVRRAGTPAEEVIARTRRGSEQVRAALAAAGISVPEPSPGSDRDGGR